METPMPDYEKMFQMWLDFASRMTAAGTTAASQNVPADAGRHVRDAYLRALTEYTDEWMRSPQFLEMMKQSTAAAVAMRKQMNDFLAQAHRAAGGLARPDVDSLLMAIRRCETRVLEKLDELSSRLDLVEAAAGQEERASNGDASRRPK